MTSSLDAVVTDDDFWNGISAQTDFHAHGNESDLHVLVIDDNDFRASVTEDLLVEKNPNTRVTIAPHFDAFMQVVTTREWALCVVDGDFPRSDTGKVEFLGEEALEVLKKEGYDPSNVVILSGNMNMHNVGISNGYRAAEVHLGEESVSLIVEKILKKPQYRT